MTNYFENICDWRDEEERWQPTIYLEFDDVFEYRGQSFRFHYKERDWDVLGRTPEENKAMGRCCVIEVNEEDMRIKAENVSVGSVVHGESLEEAKERLKTILDIYFQLKDMTRAEYDIWSKNDR